MALLDGKVAVVTGAAQGIASRSSSTVPDSSSAISTMSWPPSRRLLWATTPSRAGRCDVVDAADLEAALLALAVSAFGGLDTMVNDDGTTRDATIRNMTEDQFDQVIAVHLKECWNVARLAADITRENKSGSIIHMSSLLDKVGLVGQTNYSAAKAGIVGLTKAAAKEVAHVGVRANAMRPGLIRSAMTEAMPQKVWEQKMDEIPMGRPGEVDEVANVALFYASDLSTYVTGIVAEVTGGRFI